MNHIQLQSAHNINENTLLLMVIIFELFFCYTTTIVLIVKGTFYDFFPCWLIVIEFRSYILFVVKVWLIMKCM